MSRAKSWKINFRVFSDQRHLKGLSQFQFRESLRLDLLPKLPARAVIQIETVDSSTDPNIQIADWICGTLHRYYTGGKNGEKFYDILRNNIIISEELFKDYWRGKYNKKPPQRDDFL